MKSRLGAIVLCGAMGCATQFKGAPDADLYGSGGDGGSSGAASSGAGGDDGGNHPGSPSSSGIGTSGGAGASGGGSGGNGDGGGGDAGATTLADGGHPAPVTCPATSTLTPGNMTATLNFGGTARQYIVHVPPTYTGKTPVPLVLDYHGILLNDTYEQTYSGYGAKADQEGFIVVYPNGIDQAWNVGPCCTSSRTVDDVGFSKAVIAQIESEACIDEKRIYAVGFSMGGGMAIKMACDAADVIAAAAPAAFDLMDPSNGWNCAPSRPITMITFRSTGDPVVPYAGGATNPPNGLPVVITFLGAVKTFQKWAQLDQCTGSPTDNSSLGAGCQTYTQCGQGVEVTLCTKQGGSHDMGDPNVAWPMISRYSLP